MYIYEYVDSYSVTFNLSRLINNVKSISKIYHLLFHVLVLFFVMTLHIF